MSIATDLAVRMDAWIVDQARLGRSVLGGASLHFRELSLTNARAHISVEVVECPPCPECAQHKHINCAAVSLAPSVDALVPCPCRTRDHQPMAG